MTSFKKFLLGSVIALVPGGVIAAAGYFLYKKFRSKDDSVHVEASDSGQPQGDDQEVT